MKVNWSERAATEFAETAAYVAREFGGQAAVKMRNAIKFLKEGNRVKVSVRFRGREMAHTNIGEDLLVQFAEGCKEVANMEKNPKLEGRFMHMFLAPKQENKK